jgi:hypothetical protein
LQRQNNGKLQLRQSQLRLQRGAGLNKIAASLLLAGQAVTDEGEVRI